MVTIVKVIIWSDFKVPQFIESGRRILFPSTGGIHASGFARRQLGRHGKLGVGSGP
jgi:hypothetical protein